MPFLDEVDDVKAKAPSGRLPHTVLAGIAVVAVAVVLLAAVGIVSSARGDFVVKDSTPSSSAANDGEAAEEGVAASSAGIAVSSGIEDAGAFSEEGQEGTCFVYVVGAVKKPGVYEVAATARVDDAVKAAGGLKADADATAVNLARGVVDGEQIVIPVEGEEPADGGAAAVSSAGSTAAGGAASATGAAGAAGATDATGAAAGASGASAGITADGKVNLNTASAAELQSLPGVGEATSSKIIASREAEGPFNAPEDLKRVSGIGDKKYAALADLIAV